MYYRQILIRDRLPSVEVQLLKSSKSIGSLIHFLVQHWLIYFYYEGAFY